MAVKPKVGVWILCDQLKPGIASLKDVKPAEASIILIEAQAVPHNRKCHKKKMVLHLAAMRHFREELEQLGFEVLYFPIEKEKSPEKPVECVDKDLREAIKKNKIKKLHWMQPTDYDHWEVYGQLLEKLPCDVTLYENNMFINSLDEFKEWEESQDDLVMENYYRIIRRKMGVLMEGDYPTGGRWNYDIENRVPPMENMDFPTLPELPEDKHTSDAIKLVKKLFDDFPGSADNFMLPVTRQATLDWFQDFVDKRLRLFGMYQDAMVKENWYMYHAIISPMMNIGLIEPMDTVSAVENSYHHSNTPINSAEGFIRQVIGWREYVRGIYWSRMPDYRKVNFFDYQEAMPQMFEDGKTRMNCVKCIVGQTMDIGYAHHIQRLMIVGNFCLLAGIEPWQAATWFLEKYVDAYEWVVLPNVLGMILFADGGYLGTKPYAASANYISKMSNYCKGCFYRPRKRVGEKACPFNFLYWNFLQRNTEVLKDNKRMSMVYNLLKRKSDGELQLVGRSSEQFLKKIHKYGTDRRVGRK
jgi:deoxyribodipyrimidine photolyase-related protein